MHWIWRTLIGIIAGCTYFSLLFSIEAFYDLCYRLCRWIDTRCGFLPSEGFAWLIVFVLPISLVTLGAFGVATRVFGLQRTRQTHCRQCQQVLRQLHEPRCPRCGEPI
ncbi:MAG: hypothetical protein JXA69_21000 [Phycisphaerae bacterium]|nr:hypothetical protein [Phycisphaerae bacterium]